MNIKKFLEYHKLHPAVIWYESKKKKNDILIYFVLSVIYILLERQRHISTITFMPLMTILEVDKSVNSFFSFQNLSLAFVPEKLDKLINSFIVIIFLKILLFNLLFLCLTQHAVIELIGSIFLLYPLVEIIYLTGIKWQHLMQRKIIMYSLVSSVYIFMSTGFKFTFYLNHCLGFSLLLIFSAILTLVTNNKKLSLSFERIILKSK